MTDDGGHEIEQPRAGHDDPDRAGWLQHGRSFGSVADAYARLRPGYPRQVLEFVVGGEWEAPRQHAWQRILDLGAGTGKLTELFLAAGYDVIAVDPAVEMLSELRASHPDVLTAVGTAESIPLPDDDVDALVVGQAAHWFDLTMAVPEIARVLRPGGVLGLIWNLRDERVQWVAELGELLAGEGSHLSSDLETVARDIAERLGWRLLHEEFAYVHVLTPDEVVAGLATRSYVVLLDVADRERLLQSARHLLGSHSDTTGRAQIEFPYRTFAYRLQA